VSRHDGGERNKEIVRALHRRLWGDADLTVIEEVVSEDAVTHWGDAETGTRDAIRSDAERYFAAFSDVSTSIDDLIGEQDKVVLRWSTIGTHTGPYGKVPPTGRMITMNGMDVYRLDSGRIVEAWSMWDGLGVYQQLGLVDREVGP
jgi:steroid delta-isomerase-like uncharacterized protein